MEQQAGRVLRTLSVREGSVSDFAAVLESDGGRFFCKGVAAENAVGWMHRNEARVNAYLPATVPRLRWQVETDGWLLLGFAHVDGRHPDLAPGSPDLPVLAATFSAMATALTPCPPVNVQSAVARWADRVAPEAVDGDTLVHTDVTPYNFLLRGGDIAVVDWSMPCRGAAWIDAALMIVRLIRAGHTAEQAEAWAGQIPVWAAARPAAVDAFARGVAVLKKQRHEQRPAAAHLGPLADAAELWARHRHSAR